jgi:hypothetical protein
MQKPPKSNAYNQEKKYQQGAGHRDVPEQKSNINYCGILGYEYDDETYEDNDQNYFEIHISRLCTGAGHLQRISVLVQIAGTPISS